MIENVCTFDKFGYCKFEKKCRKLHHLELCESYFCENVRNCGRRHPRKCYYFCAYGYCKFGEDCRFRHNINTINVTLAKNDGKIKEENILLKKDLEELGIKHEKTLLHLDNLMEHQSTQNIVKNDDIKKEIKVHKDEFDQVCYHK